MRRWLLRNGVPTEVPVEPGCSDTYLASQSVDQLMDKEWPEGEREKFLAVLAKVPDVPPDPGDKL